MWIRDTFHKCATELLQISRDFRKAYELASPVERRRGNLELLRCSKEGVALLRSLALAIRSEQDYKIIPEDRQVVGGLLQSSEEIFTQFESEYRSPYCLSERLGPLVLRDALNKIAHANPMLGSYRVLGHQHEILIAGTQRAKYWIAAISLPSLAATILALPDEELADGKQDIRTREVRA